MTVKIPNGLIGLKYFFTISYSLAVRFELFDPNEIIASVWVNSCETYFLRCLLMEEIYICACV